ncbi:MAG: bifunctional pantoate--beta-alanine ligase/(d)CMP kinase [Phormidesmis sp. CAN_BIN36]|nr:bifunctional pantoate--beta-alanine ligase/(d)CMP kinase [Phormidesmis sp. CAN_BIN36]
MRLFTTVAALRCYLDLCRRSQSYSNNLNSLKIGLVPTMGALHAGHLSLIRQAGQENGSVVVTIFVNPLQLAPNEDFQQYPRTLERDKELCEQAGVSAIFAPTAAELGIDRQNSTQVIPPTLMTSVLCGAFRPGHFEGVATIVTKLLNLVQPDRAYFGRKDAQQLAIIQRLVTDLNLPVEIVPCPIVRERDGLALSSRNQYLSVEERQQAVALYRGLSQAEKAFRSGERLSANLIQAIKKELEKVPAMKTEYVELVHPITLTPLEVVEEAGLLATAVRLGSTRLIDNVLLRTRKPILAIDGPAGAGKSTVARRVAEKLNLFYLDTGAMYRALTWLVLQSGIAVDDEPAIAELVSQSHIEFRDYESDAQRSKRIVINNRDVTEEIRDVDVTANVSAISAHAVVRKVLVKQQQRYGSSGGIAIEGRDIGTCVFPDAEVKIFLTASVQERARRRQQDLKNQGKGEISLDELEQSIFERDRKDSTRAISPLRKADDAIEIQTDHLSADEVVRAIVNRYREKLAP